jgi:hypothetical protein
LSSNAGDPDTDGNVDLSWTISSGADNYSVYQHVGFINDINGSLTELVYQTASSPLPITDLSSGFYYFLVVAYNETGYTYSNCLEIVVEIPEPPDPFTLSSSAGSPDTDGNFDLSWTSSLGADNYSIYRYPGFINQINGSLTLVADQTATSPFPLRGLNNGAYHFIVVAHNQVGDTLSNCIGVNVLKREIPGYNLSLFFLAFLGITYLLVRLKLKGFSQLKS